MLTPAFHFRILDTFLEVFNEQSTILVQILEKKYIDGGTFDIFPHITKCALDVISGKQITFPLACLAWVVSKTVHEGESHKEPDDGAFVIFLKNSFSLVLDNMRKCIGLGAPLCPLTLFFAFTRSRFSL